MQTLELMVAKDVAPDIISFNTLLTAANAALPPLAPPASASAVEAAAKAEGGDEAAAKAERRSVGSEKETEKQREASAGREEICELVFSLIDVMGEQQVRVTRTLSRIASASPSLSTPLS